MKTKPILWLLMAMTSLAIAGPLGYTFNRTNNTITFTYVETAGVNYSLVRHDIRSNYYDVLTNWNATVSGTNTFTIDPNEVNDEYRELPFRPSGAYWFYIAEYVFPPR